MTHSWIVRMLSSPKGAAILASIVIAVAGAYFIFRSLNIRIKGHEKLIKAIGKFINYQEKRYHRDVAIGKLTEKRAKVKLYKFLNDLIIALD